jgi:acyl-CoA synthetase (AMP-forming)/AMP-acid ligase II
MATLQRSFTTLSGALSESGDPSGCSFQDAEASRPFIDILSGSALYGRADELEGRSVLLATTSQLTTASALIELDGMARRIVLCPPDLPLEHLPYVIDTAEVDGIVSDRAITQVGRPRPLYFSPCSRTLEPANPRGAPSHETEWILLTSGTTGVPKLVAHTLRSLTAAIGQSSENRAKVVWSTFYDIRRYGGLQILLRAALSGSSLVLSSSDEPTADFLARAASSGVTHISGTPSQWRRALMSPSAHLLNPEYVRLSGEAVDQAILDRLRSCYPKARIVHAFASTEAGVAFEVADGMLGFLPEALHASAHAEMKIEDNTLRVRSVGNARRYLGNGMPPIRDHEGFVDTGDMVTLRDGRYFFAGRRDGVINVGGLKVHPEEVEAVIGRHPEVQMCLVRAKKSPVIGALVVADVVLRSGAPSDAGSGSAIQDDILQLCREVLPAHKVPAAVNIVPALNVSGSGKVVRRDA